MQSQHSLPPHSHAAHTHTLPHSEASWRHVRHAKMSVRSARTHVLAAKLSLIPPRPTLSWFICALFHTTLTPLHTHAHTHSLAEIALLRAQAKNIDDKHFRAFPAYIIYANISLLCLATGSLIRKILTQKSSLPSPNSPPLLLPLDTAEMPMARGYFPCDYLNCFYWPFNEAYASCAEPASTVTRRQSVPQFFLPFFLNVFLKHSPHGAHKGANWIGKWQMPKWQ